MTPEGHNWYIMCETPSPIQKHGVQIEKRDDICNSVRQFSDGDLTSLAVLFHVI